MSRIETILLKKLRQYLVTRARQQMMNGRSRYLSREKTYHRLHNKSKLGQRNNMVYKMSKRVQNTTLGYYIYIKGQKDITDGRNGQRPLCNR